jgi:prophage DNA circulation protein
MPDNEVAQLFPIAKWEVEGETITIPTLSIDEGYRNRIVSHERVYRDGARLDDTGGGATTWTIAADWYNGNEEQGLEKPDTQYPDQVDKMAGMCKVHATGTLTLPTAGPRRCRLESYGRIDNFEDRDQAAVVYVFIEDNEDDSTQADFQQVSGAAAARKKAQEGTDAAFAEGAGGGFDMSDLNAFAAELEALANAPGDFVGDLEAKANAIQRKVESVEDTFTRVRNEAVTEVSLLLTNPGASLPLRRLRQVADLGKRMAEKKAAGQLGATTTTTVKKATSIFQLATKFQQDPGKLMTLNSGIEDMLSIPAGTTITIFDTPAVRSAKTT